ncbi:MAG: deoxyhypusine synthase family protein [Nitrospirae bacterium]|nr:deoxyhypusine synthase family protein [Nitrospirota bacterium]
MPVKKAKEIHTVYNDLSHKAKRPKRWFRSPIVPFEPKADGVADVLERMEDVSFQARNLARAFAILREMVQDRVTIMMALSGAMTPAGMGEIIMHMIRNRYIDCLVSTGANLFHDIVNSLGGTHWKGTDKVDDMVLRDHFVDRVYDTFGNEREYHFVDEIVADFASSLDPTQRYSTRRFLYLLGERLAKLEKRPSILSTAYRAKVPVFCPAIADSSLGIALGFGQAKLGLKLCVDTIADVVETAVICGKSHGTGIFILGGGVAKNFVQQAQVTSQWIGFGDTAHEYAVQITQDSPVWGGLSGATFEEAQSWGKITRGARKIQVYCDSTIALPILISGLVDSKVRRRRHPRFDLSGPELALNA